MFKVLKISKEDLEEAIPGLESLKPILQKQARIGNGKDRKQGEIDAAELGKHFDTAINSMVTILAWMEVNVDNAK
ncbi:hypothetical protein [Clostridium chromiireducens]|nr:hypothetical protein [Clostridium chromiireducens]